MSGDRLFSIALGLATLAMPLWAQSTNESSLAQNAGQKQVAGKPGETDPLKRPLTEKEKQQRAKASRHELSAAEEDWLRHQVRYIISPEEEQAFLALSNEEERTTFIFHFWDMRDPTPDTPENEFKDEHYRRLTYADEHFSAGIPGWKTDRGMIYIKYGPPDEIESHPSGGAYQRPIDEGGGTMTTFPFEAWRYRHLEEVGENVIIEFVDSCQCGEYHMTIDPEEKNAGKYTPGGQQPDALQRDRQSSKVFDDLEIKGKLQRSPRLKWGDRPDVSSIIHYDLLPFDLRVDFIKAALDKVLVPVTIQVQNRDITFENKEGIARGVLNVDGHVYTMTGQVVQAFEDPVSLDVPADLLEKTLQNRSVYWNAFPLPAGRYRIDVVLKDLKGDRMGAISKSFAVPAFSEDRLASSSLILADLMEKVPRGSVGAGSFVIDDTRVRPRVEGANGKPASFRRDQKMNVWMQVYNLGVDGQSKKPSATIEYDVVDAATNAPVLHLHDSTTAMGTTGDTITLKQTLSLEKMTPGAYRLTVKVNDQLSQQTISPSVSFMVE